MHNRDKHLEYSGVVQPILKYLNSLPNAKAINIHGSVFCERGTPDIIGCINGRTILLECKRSPTETAEKIQEWRMAEWRRAGAIAARVDNVQQVKELLDKG
nr:MAG TPA: Nuclease [Caudoviricetes sp.]